MNIMNNKGPKTDPCGTPLITEVEHKTWPLSTTCCFLLLKKFSIHLKIMYYLELQVYIANVYEAQNRRLFESTNKSDHPI